FGLTGDGFLYTWEHAPLRTLPIAYRHDGFSLFFEEPPMTWESLLEGYVAPLAGTNATISVWGLGPGSVFCYDTKVGEVFGEGLSQEQLGMLREGDRWVHENVMGLIRSGNDPLRVAAERGRELGLKTLARLEMNHEYGPASEDNWLWVGLVGRFNKEHPEYRIGGRSVLLDFKHKQLRDFKLAIFREALEAGSDGISADFAVYPPFFAEPAAGTPIMTGFIRDVRALLDEFGAQQGRRLELMVRVPARNANELGLDWQTWMREGLIDYIVPTHYRPNETFDIRVEEFVALGRKTGVMVYPCIWQVLGFVSTDQHPEDEKTGNRRYDKPKTEEMFFAQALLFHRAGADGLQLGFSEDQWRKRPYLNDLAEPEKVLYANKHYMVDVLPHCPITFEASGGRPPTPVERTVPLRLGDDVAEARARGYRVEAELVLYATPLHEGERVEIFVNGQGPAVVAGAEPGAEAEGDGAPVDPRRIGDKIFEKEWWRRGERHVQMDAGWWRLGENEIRLVYRGAQADAAVPFSITWVDLLLRYQGPR
ncbi:MAG: hypothetical protein JXR94_07250, partial [Candidatus Hydrogenedentes bacterium]|nr:hypothetical protein [Candidatus Hydrogenedentota bacterium]